MGDISTNANKEKNMLSHNILIKFRKNRFVTKIRLQTNLKWSLGRKSEKVRSRGDYLENSQFSLTRLNERKFYTKKLLHTSYTGRTLNKA